MKYQKDENTLHKVYRYYIRGDYHCDVCPYSWEERGEEDADAGCYLFGELRDTCRYIRNPISRMIVNGRLNDADHAYDGFQDYDKELEILDEVLHPIIELAQDTGVYSEAFKNFVITFTATEQHDLIAFICSKYELMKHPYQTPWRKLKSAYMEWHKDFWYRHFRRYFRRKLR